MSDPVIAENNQTDNSTPQSKLNSAAMKAWGSNLAPIFVGCASQQKASAGLSNKPQQPVTSVSYVY
jgi:hypothetical protein